MKHSLDLGTRAALHHLAQALGMAGRIYGVPQPDDSHTALGWDPARAAFVTVLPSGTLALPVAAAAIEWTPTGGASERFAAARRSRQDLDAQLRAWFAAAGLDAGRFTLRAPYDLPEHPVQSGARFVFDGDTLAALAALYSGTHAALAALAAVTPGSSPVRTWPHHFDMATLVTLSPGDPSSQGEHARSVGLGFSPGDAGHADPYWYATPWPYPPAERLGAAPADWAWNTAGWTGLMRAAPVGAAPGFDAAFAAARRALA